MTDLLTEKLIEFLLSRLKNGVNTCIVKRSEDAYIDGLKRESRDKMTTVKSLVKHAG